jgi:geranylgeranyl diphosphate synthase type II
VASFDLQAYQLERGKQIMQALDRYTPSADTPPVLLHQAMRYSLMGGGKRIRPLLCVAGAESVGGEAEAVFPMACALEMIHTFSLIHDDLPAIDNDDMRRGRATLHKAYDESTAILAGDALHALAFGTIADHQTGDPSRVLRCVALLAESAGTLGMVGGQVDDIYYERREYGYDILRSIHARKTGALINAAILSGAILCGATPEQEAALTHYGNEVGVAFQIVDDCLDVTGDTATLGKPAKSDLKLDKATYPKLFGLEKSEQMARQASKSALSALSDFGPSADPLRAFAHYIVERQT